MKNGTDSLVLIRKLRRQRECAGRNEARGKDIPFYLCRADTHMKTGKDLAMARRAATRMVRGRENNRDAAQKNDGNHQNDQDFMAFMHKASLAYIYRVLKPWSTDFPHGPSLPNFDEAASGTLLFDQLLQIRLELFQPVFYFLLNLIPDRSCFFQLFIVGALKSRRIVKAPMKSPADPRKYRTST